MPKNNIKHNCPKCNLEVVDGIACDICNKWFHSKCCGLSAQEYAKMELDKESNWYCLKCKSSANNPNTMFTILLSKFNKMQNSYEDLIKDVKSTAADQKALKTTLSRMSNDFGEFKRNMPQMINEIVSKKVDDVVADIDLVKSDIAGIKLEIEALKSGSGHCEGGVQQRLLRIEEQSERQLRMLKRNDILVTGVPNTGIDLMKVVMDMFNVLEAGISEIDISNCCYLNKNKSIILVSFQSLQKRNMVMLKYYKHGKLDLSMFMSTGVRNRIYFNDNLPPKLSLMAKLARKLKKNGNIKSFSVGLSHIAMKADDSSVKNYATLEDIISMYPELNSTVTANTVSTVSTNSVGPGVER